MALAHTLMVFILIVSFGVLAAVFVFWAKHGKLMQDTPKETVAPLEFTKWETTLLMH